ncbi:hypothetical protein PtA15_12A180 [Puccinia triticina]|uniref:Enkurin domain-containing protein n=1 Tax=Puccinia triticina TaxID=208348 RepID=A0ABY7CY09_9BASI|nr:uncharacterized protein PtA15_12A180 [Puccinia triticina]WAQ90194.1 hypothetical protein PtA15_12A180 [Puccinia triticina]
MVQAHKTHQLRRPGDRKTPQGSPSWSNISPPAPLYKNHGCPEGKDKQDSTTPPHKKAWTKLQPPVVSKDQATQDAVAKTQRILLSMKKDIGELLWEVLRVVPSADKPRAVYKAKRDAIGQELDAKRTQILKRLEQLP